MSRGPTASLPVNASERLAAERTAVVTRLRDLQHQVDDLAEQQSLTTHDDEHDPEGVTIAVMRAQLQGLLADAKRELTAVDDAVARVEGGIYGRCLTCGRPIAEERLEARPTASTCITCADHRRR